MRRVPIRWWLRTAVAALALTGLVVAGVAVFTGDGSPAGHIADRYTRAPEADPAPQAHAYTTRLSASRVTDDLTGTWRPAARHLDATGVYLRYATDIVVIRPATGGGTLILIEPTATAYPRYQTQIGSAW